MLVLGHEAEVELVARGGDTVGARVVGALGLADLGALVVAAADVGPGVAVVAVGCVGLKESVHESVHV